MIKKQVLFGNFLHFTIIQFFNSQLLISSSIYTFYRQRICKKTFVILIILAF